MQTNGKPQNKTIRTDTDTKLQRQRRIRSVVILIEVEMTTQTINTLFGKYNRFKNRKCPVKIIVLFNTLIASAH